MFGLFKSKKTDEIGNVDWSLIAVDFHSHLLPKVDDGVNTIEDTIEILHFFKSKGYQSIYTSPHIMGEGFKNTKQGLKEKFEDLLQDKRIQSIGLKFNLIAEYFLDEEFENLLTKDDLLTFGNKHILVETSMNYDFPFVKDYIFELRKKGYIPILAHPERYKYIYSEKDFMDIYETYKDLGVLFQLNLFSLIGMYGDKVKSIAETLIEQNMYDFVSSDIHSVSQIKYLEQVQKSIFLERLIQSGNLKNKQILA